MESFFNEEGWCYTVSYDEIYSEPSISEYYRDQTWASYLVEFLFSYYVFTKIN